ncbi:winged helix-turn-helix domain-containing protein [Salipiger bermudensis]|uniref:winged helix-turn-helix domain-containing protein n=1 Tax=Salipiger bermudensis TaxID=344736 RepID=UPI001CD6CD0D|nr:LysR family transcriptional regulator [Salipiger bermudensis]MCA0963586.1 LysR family transcriptional regulator [Salipiger bermudensis]
MTELPPPPDRDDAPDPRLRLRILFGDSAMLGPGKAELLDRIAETGSIAAAGRAMAMSYKRAWSLVEEMNHAFRAPLVERNRGGTRGGGARLTETGVRVLSHYRRVERAAAAAGAEDIAALKSLLSDMSQEK